MVLMRFLMTLWLAILPRFTAEPQIFYNNSSGFFVTTDFTTANNVSLQVITGLSKALPASTALNIVFHCVLGYSQATAAVSDNFGIRISNTAPTNLGAFALVYTSATASTTGSVLAIGTTVAQALTTGTPNAIGTVYNAYIDGTLEAVSNATPSTLNIMVGSSVGADAITIKRGSFCGAHYN